MHTYLEAFRKLRTDLIDIYGVNEAAAIAKMVIEQLSGMTYTQMLVSKEVSIDKEKALILEEVYQKLVNGIPIQYALGYADFYGLSFKVNEAVLIPRPETEELVVWIIKDYEGEKDKQINLLDIGTGSGCIPITIKKHITESKITSCDISKEALDVAQKNADSHNTSINFIQLDFLNNNDWNTLGCYDVIVSNPPYIPESDRAEMHENVKDYEPNIALFVPTEDPQIFYRQIAIFGQTHLNNDGCIYCELHKDHGVETEILFKELGYKTELRKDMHGNDRMLKAKK